MKSSLLRTRGSRSLLDFGIDLVPQSARLFRDRTAAAARPPPGARAGTLTLKFWHVPIWSQRVAGCTHIVGYAHIEDVLWTMVFVLCFSLLLITSQNMTPVQMILNHSN